MSNTAEFLDAFLAATPVERAQMIRNIHRHNTDVRLSNLFAVINLNDVSVRNRRLPDNIHYICGMLRSFIGLKLNWRL